MGGHATLWVGTLSGNFLFSLFAILIYVFATGDVKVMVKRTTLKIGSRFALNRYIPGFRENGTRSSQNIFIQFRAKGHSDYTFR